MTDEEWRVCTAPARMRRAMRNWANSQRRWVRFDLACLDRVHDLIEDTQCRTCITIAANATERNIKNWNWPGGGARACDVIRELWRQRSDPLQQAKIAALRAVSCFGSHNLTTSHMVCVAVGRRAGQQQLQLAVAAEQAAHAALVRCVFRSTLSPVNFAPEWRTGTTTAIVREMYESRDFSAMPILADALQDAGCDNEDVLAHCHDASGLHVRGCWVVDLVLGKE